MTKSQVVDKMADAGGMTKAEAGRVLDVVLGVVTDALRRGEKVTLTGFGTFEVRTRRARRGRNPQTGETIQIPQSRTPAFKAGKALKDSVR